MRTCRTCSHIKTNGTKCGSPALRHQTLCYFHYQWDRRERRRVRLGGPVGLNKNTGIELPILEGPESIMLALMEVQHALLDARIDRLTAHTLLYSLQLAMQLKISTFTGLSSRLQSVTTCPELESDRDLARARGTTLNPCHPERSAAVSREVEGPSVSNSTPLDPCHPERSAAVLRGVEGPCVSSPEATTLDLHPNLETSPILAVETQNSKLESANVITKIEAAAPERKQKALRLRAIPPRSAQGDTSTVTENRQYKTGQQSGRIANPALKGGANRAPSLRDENHCELGCESRMADRSLVPRASHLLYFDI